MAQIVPVGYPAKTPPVNVANIHNTTCRSFTINRIRNLKMMCLQIRPKCHFEM